ncbi:hypothetical protein OS493_002598 [Desmophyllum pertusum]|uniref:F-box domain-containing protein n=1 Tax=Desmophyllum pertusum TaxID=174260 RepID=A0A9X0CMZ1_9CNID|nr:hypothetical protein OS493_002598 [Desmophyllum pertusum]
MDALPNELLAYILEFLHPVYDNLARLSLVCKQWKEVVESTPSLWKCIHFTRAYPLCVTEYARHRDVLRHCLFKFGHYITCLRDHPITRTFTDPSLRELLSRLTNLTCLDVPLLEWDPRFLQTLQCASVLEELNLTEYLRSEPPEIQWLFQQPESLEKNFITPQHLQMVLLRFPRLKVLKLALDSIAFPPCTLSAFLDKVKLTKLELSGFGLIPTLPPHIIHNRDMCLKTIASSQRLAAVVTRLELRTCPLFFHKRPFANHAEAYELTSSSVCWRWRGPVTADEFTGFPHDRSTCSIFIRSRKLERVSINLPNATAIAVKCEELKHLSVTMGEIASDCKAALDFEVIAGKVSFIRTTNCKFSRYHLQSKRIGKIALQLCEMERDESIPRLDVQTKAMDKLVLDNCHHLQCAELRVKPDRIAHVSFSECNNLRNIVMSRAVKCPPEISVVKCKNLESILHSSGRQIDLSNVNVAGCPGLNIHRLQQNGNEKVRLVCQDEDGSKGHCRKAYLN